MSRIELEGVQNVRDLGGIRLADGRSIVPGLFFRGSALNHPSDLDTSMLADRLKIRHIIDLRVGWELEAKPDVPIPGAEYHHIPLFDKEIVGIDYVKPLPGTVMIGYDFACDSRDFYSTMANPLTVAQLAKVLQLIFLRAKHGEPVYFHCSGGKDRAGVTAALLLYTLGASEESILEDYLLTNDSRDRHYAHIYERFLRLCNGDAEFAREVTDAHRADPENLSAFHAELDRRYGGLDAFVRNQLGISDEQRETYHRMFTE